MGGGEGRGGRWVGADGEMNISVNCEQQEDVPSNKKIKHVLRNLSPSFFLCRAQDVRKFRV